MFHNDLLNDFRNAWMNEIVYTCLFSLLWEEDITHALPGWSSQYLPKASITWKFYEVLTSSPVPPPLLRHVLSVFLAQKEFRDWRGGSAVRSPDCSSRGPSFDSQHAHVQYQLSGTPFSRHLASSLVSVGARHACAVQTHI